jgi:hypothetical protein
MRGLTGTIGAENMNALINKIYQHVLYNKQELLPNYVKKYSKEIHILNDSIERYISLA